MAFWGKKNEKILDLSEKYSEEIDVRNSKRDDEFSGTAEERKKKLAKRILDMSNKIDEISNQIYKIQQRIEVLEKKANLHSN